MNLDFFEKCKIILQYVSSSFLGVELFILSFLLFVLLIVSSKKNKELYRMLAGFFYIGFLLSVLFCYSEYAKMSVHEVLKFLMKYIYFPSTILYFFIMLFVGMVTIYTIWSKKMTKLKRIINYFFVSLMYFFFTSFMSLAIHYHINLADTKELYKKEVILSIVQVSNIFFLVWLIFSFFYYLYHYFQKNFDQKNS